MGALLQLLNETRDMREAAQLLLWLAVVLALALILAGEWLLARWGRHRQPPRHERDEVRQRLRRDG